MRTPPLALLALGVAVTTGLAVACGGGADAGTRDVDVSLVEQSDGRFAIEPADLTVSRGEKIHFRIRNDGTQDHEFESSDAHIEEIKVPPGKTREVTWTARATGDFEIICDLPGHKAAGMVMTAHVR